MIKAKKHFGQNFLKDETVLSKIVQAISNDKINIVEIGPGLGDLTFWLLKSKFFVTSYEIDRELIPILEKKFKEQAQNGQFKLINKDAVLAWKEDVNLNKEPYVLVANLPYYIATKLILNALEDELCQEIIVMVQKEVAIKFSTSGQDANFSSLGVLGNLVGNSNLLFDVEPECFYPVPKVISSVFKITKSSKLIGKDGLFDCKNEYNEFKKYLKCAFVSPRKTLVKNLSSYCNKSLLEEIFIEFNLSKNLRPHELNVTLFLKIFKKVKDEQRKERCN